mmetsp:Transcript_43127/g.116471  ORF Transcript_43127/g.116471 Transcript_43127/m.116471 type:complete len:203 (-) Transcript_43127:504-1112(-)
MPVTKVGCVGCSTKYRTKMATMNRPITMKLEASPAQIHTPSLENSAESAVVAVTSVHRASHELSFPSFARRGLPTHSSPLVPITFSVSSLHRGNRRRRLLSVRQLSSNFFLPRIDSDITFFSRALAWEPAASAPSPLSSPPSPPSLPFSAPRRPLPPLNHLGYWLVDALRRNWFRTTLALRSSPTELMSCCLNISNVDEAVS